MLRAGACVSVCLCLSACPPVRLSTCPPMNPVCVFASLCPFVCLSTLGKKRQVTMVGRLRLGFRRNAVQPTAVARGRQRCAGRPTGSWLPLLAAAVTGSGRLARSCRVAAAASSGQQPAGKRLLGSSGCGGSCSSGSSGNRRLVGGGAVGSSWPASSCRQREITTAGHRFLHL